MVVCCMWISLAMSFGLVRMSSFLSRSESRDGISLFLNIF
jgi:hypothetical protein